MLKGGLVSVTFRQLSPEEIIQLVVKTSLTGIEWGGDIHVPHGDLKRAKHVRALTESMGLKVSSYGSYYKVGESEGEGLSFRSVLDSARELGAPVIRVWAGKKGSDVAVQEDWDRVVDDSLRIAEMAATECIKVAYEYHGKTLTDTNDAAQKLLSLARHGNLFSYWQPPVGTSHDYCLQGLRNLRARLAHLHVYCWQTKEGKLQRLPLAMGHKEWSDYFSLAGTGNDERYALLEFVENNDPECFLRDAITLTEWINNVTQTRIIRKKNL